MKAFAKYLFVFCSSFSQVLFSFNPSVRSGLGADCFPGVNEHVDSSLVNFAGEGLNLSGRRVQPGYWDEHTLAVASDKLLGAGMGESKRLLFHKVTSEITQKRKRRSGIVTRQFFAGLLYQLLCPSENFLVSAISGPVTFILINSDRNYSYWGRDG